MELEALPRLRTHRRNRAGVTKHYYYWDGRGRGCHDVALGSDPVIALERYKQCESGIIPPPLHRVSRAKPKPPSRPKRLLKIRPFDGKTRRRIDPEAWRGLPEWAPRMYLKAEARARELNRAFTLTIAQFANVIERAQGRCELTGMAFDATKLGPNIKSPYAASLDRIDSTRGYEASNVRLVCLIVNVALSNWGEGPVRAMAEALLRNMCSASVPLEPKAVGGR